MFTSRPHANLPMNDVSLLCSERCPAASESAACMPAASSLLVPNFVRLLLLVQPFLHPSKRVYIFGGLASITAAAIRALLVRLTIDNRRACSCTRTRYLMDADSELTQPDLIFKRSVHSPSNLKVLGFILGLDHSRRILIHHLSSLKPIVFAAIFFFANPAVVTLKRHPPQDLTTRIDQCALDALINQLNLQPHTPDTEVKYADRGGEKIADSSRCTIVWIAFPYQQQEVAPVTERVSLASPIRSPC